MGNKNGKEKRLNKEINQNETIKSRLNYNILFIGEIKIGTKTSLIKRMKEGIFIDITGMTGEYNEKLFIEKNNKKVILNLIDTNGYKDKRNEISKYYKNADCIILGYDITNQKSFEEIKTYWYKEIKKLKNINLIYLLGNKIDLEEKIEVSEKDGKKFTKKNKLPFLQISVKEDINIQIFINDLLSRIEKDIHTKFKGILMNYKIEDNFDDEDENEVPCKSRCKIIFLGECAIGSKTTLIYEMSKRLNPHTKEVENPADFIGINVKMKNNKNVKLELWDTAGQEKFRAVNKIFIKGSDIIVLGYDITRKKTFEEINFWYQISMELSVPKLMYLIGNKIDLFEKIEIDEKEALDFAKTRSLRHFFTSCKTGQGINEFINDLINELNKWY